MNQNCKPVRGVIDLESIKLVKLVKTRYTDHCGAVRCALTPVRITKACQQRHTQQHGLAVLPAICLPDESDHFFLLLDMSAKCLTVVESGTRLVEKGCVPVNHAIASWCILCINRLS